MPSSCEYKAVRAPGRKKWTRPRIAPFGNEAWISPIAARLGLEFTLRPRGRRRRQGQASGGTEGLLMFDGPTRE
jgi:hypothetical protein